jgi:hypothetical protein
MLPCFIAGFGGENGHLRIEVHEVAAIELEIGVDGADLDLLLGGELVEGPGLRAGIGEVEAVGNAEAEQVQVFVEDNRGLRHVQVVHRGGIQLDQFAGEEIGLLLVVALDADPVAAAQNRLQQRQGVGLVDELAGGEGGRGAGPGEIAVAQMVEFHDVFLVRGGVFPI